LSISLRYLPQALAILGFPKNLPGSLRIAVKCQDWLNSLRFLQAVISPKLPGR
jgi:hypothetical protein